MNTYKQTYKLLDLNDNKKKNSRLWPSVVLSIL